MWRSSNFQSSNLHHLLLHTFDMAPFFSSYDGPFAVDSFAAAKGEES